MLKRAANDPLPSQSQNYYYPDPVDTSVPRQNQEFVLEKILAAKKKRRGRGFQRIVLVKWTGQAETTWEPRSEFKDTIALQNFENIYGEHDDVGETNMLLKEKKKKKKSR